MREMDRYCSHAVHEFRVSANHMCWMRFAGFWGAQTTHVGLEGGVLPGPRTHAHAGLRQLKRTDRYTKLGVCSLKTIVRRNSLNRSYAKDRHS